MADVAAALAGYSTACYCSGRRVEKFKCGSADRENAGEFVGYNPGGRPEIVHGRA